VRLWAFPSWNGDFRLIEDANDKKASQLLIMQPTPHELQLLRGFMVVARRKKWTTEIITDDETITTRTIALAAPLDQVGPALVKIVKPKDRTLTAVSFKGGRLEVAETGMLETLVAKAANDDEAKAVSVSRPTPCCPKCEPGAIAPARDVLLSFLNDQEHADWAEHRAIMVHGGLSGHRYLLAHRNSPTAVRLGKICYDMDEHFVLHFHDNAVPPEEEILAAKLILEHREPWLRNEATVIQLSKRDGTWHDLGFSRYKNPFGDVTDGRDDASITALIGMAAEYALRRAPAPRQPPDIAGIT
jgi:hypothetical protein